MGRIDASARAARIREEGYRFEAQLRELERQFDAKARELSEEYVSTVDELKGKEQSARWPSAGTLDQDC